MFKSGNALGCANGLENSSNDNARGIVLMPNFGVSFGVGISDAVDFVGKVGDVVGVTTEFATSVCVGAIAIDVGVGDTFVAGLIGLTGDTGLVTFVGFVSDFVQVLDVVTHVPLHVGCE